MQVQCRYFESICEKLHAAQFPPSLGETRRNETNGRWHDSRRNFANEPEGLEPKSQQIVEDPVTRDKITTSLRKSLWKADVWERIRDAEKYIRV